MPWRRALSAPSSAAVPREATVESAAPISPRCSPRISAGSRHAATAAPDSVTVIERRAAPSARSSDEKPMPSAISGRNGETMRT